MSANKYVNSTMIALLNYRIDDVSQSLQAL